jgi:hypothetical protein
MSNRNLCKTTSVIEEQLCNTFVRQCFARLGATSIDVLKPNRPVYGGPELSADAQISLPPYMRPLVGMLKASGLLPNPWDEFCLQYEQDEDRSRVDDANADCSGQ